MTAHATPAAGEDATSDYAPTFSARLRAATGPDHRDAESAGLMDALTADPLDRVLYVQYLAQLHVIYGGLEDAGDHLVDHPTVGAFIRPELFRRPALTADLDLLVGAGWPARMHVLPATTRYADRLHHVAASWPAGYLAHHYTRYLGDLSGGLIIGQTIAHTLGGSGVAGRSFFVFDEIGDPTAFKTWYRDRLDRLDWESAEQDRVIAEVRLAYRLNVEVMADVMRACGR